jgi:hypothetical protein
MIEFSPKEDPFEGAITTLVLTTASFKEGKTGTYLSSFGRTDIITY